MINKSKELQIFYEIAISIGSSLDLNEMLRVSLSKILKKLNCNSIILYSVGDDSNRSNIRRKYSIPTNLTNRKEIKLAEKFIIQNLKETSTSLLENLPLAKSFNEYFCHIFKLAGVGILCLFKKEKLPEKIIKNLTPIVIKLTSAYKACTQNKEIQLSHNQMELRVKRRTKDLEELNNRLINEINEKNKFEDELHKLNNEQRLILSSINSILISVNSDNRIFHWNETAKKAFGYQLEEVKNTDFFQMDIDWNWNELKQKIKQCVSDNTSIEITDFVYKNEQNQTRFLNLRINPLTDDENDSNGFLIVGEDVTHQKILQSQLLQAQKMESIGQLAAGIAHEINTPSQFVNDNLNFFKESFPSLKKFLELKNELLNKLAKKEINDKIIAKLNDIYEEEDLEFILEEFPTAIEQSLEGLSRIRSIVKAMKTFSHKGESNKQLVNINHLINSTITISRNEWKYVADIETNFDEELPEMSLNPDEFNQVILNLIVNAAHAIEKYMKEKNLDDKGRILISTTKREKFAEIKVKDTGSGIPENIRSRIFEPFFTTKKRGKGTGQGLNLSKKIIEENHNGSLSFETEWGKGTTFIIKLPFPKET